MILPLKLKKVIRYAMMYGLQRTLIKIKGTQHLKSDRTFEGNRWVNIACDDIDSPDRNVAIIGCGNFAFSNIAFYCGKENKKFLRYAYDPLKSRSLSLCKNFRGAFAVADWKDILIDSKVKLVFIASNHASHAQYAVECIRAGKHVHIEKPHVVSYSQLDDLLSSMRSCPEVKVFLGFNRPRSSLFRELQDYLSRESGPMMINWFVAGHFIADNHWYFDHGEGGRVLGNLSHWTDLTLNIIGVENAFPCKITPTPIKKSQSDFALTFVFADQSCAAMTFSAKGEIFEGVREVLNIHKGNLIATLTDFKNLKVDVGHKKRFVSPRLRDHGHRANIINSLHGGADCSGVADSIKHTLATAKLMLAAKEAIETHHAVEIFLER